MHLVRAVTPIVVVAILGSCGGGSPSDVAGGSLPPDETTETNESTTSAEVTTVTGPASGIAFVALGGIGTGARRPSALVYVGAPVSVTVGIVLIAYAANLWRRFVLDRRPGRPARGEGAAAASGPIEGESSVLTASVVMLLLLSLFWNVSHYAVIKGRNLAATVEAILPSRPGVIVYSEKRLFLQAPVLESSLNLDNAAYNFAYSGLKLLFRSDRRYFLRPSEGGSRTNIVLPDGPGIRLEFIQP